MVGKIKPQLNVKPLLPPPPERPGWLTPSLLPTTAKPGGKALSSPQRAAHCPAENICFLSVFPNGLLKNLYEKFDLSYNSLAGYCPAPSPPDHLWKKQMSILRSNTLFKINFVVVLLANIKNSSSIFNGHFLLKWKQARWRTY